MSRWQRAFDGIDGRRCALLLVSLLTFGCQQAGEEPQGTAADGPPLAPHGDLEALPDLVPAAEPVSDRGNPQTYQVLGRTYRTAPSAEGYDQTGVASWYGRKFHGRQTSSGESFDMYQLSAAHRTLPLPTYVEVTNLDNQRRAVLRINDRGPFHDDRILDLSYAAAVKLGFHHHGTARVRVRALIPAANVPAAQLLAGPEAPLIQVPQPKYQTAEGRAAALAAPAAADAAADPAVTSEPAEQFYVQAGAFRAISGARSLVDRLSGLASVPTIIVQNPSDALFKVRLGPVPDRAAAQRLTESLAAADHAGALILPASSSIATTVCAAPC